MGVVTTATQKLLSNHVLCLIGLSWSENLVGVQVRCPWAYSSENGSGSGWATHYENATILLRVTPYDGTYYLRMIDEWLTLEL